MSKTYIHKNYPLLFKTTIGAQRVVGKVLHSVEPIEMNHLLVDGQYYEIKEDYEEYYVVQLVKDHKLDDFDCKVCCEEFYQGEA